MKKINWVFILNLIMLMGCSSNSNPDLYLSKNDLNKDGITEILNPDIDTQGAIGYVANALPTIILNPNKTFQSRELITNNDISPLLKINSRGELAPVFAKGSFDRNSVPVISHITKLENDKVYILFSDLIRYNDTLCSLVELTSQNSVRCIDSQEHRASILNTSSNLPRDKALRENFVFINIDGSLIYPSLKSDSPNKIFNLYQRKTDQSLELFSPTTVYKRLVRANNNSFYSFCNIDGKFEFCSLSSTGVYKTIFRTPQALNDAQILSDNTMITFGNPTVPIDPHSFYYQLKLWDLTTNITYPTSIKQDLINDVMTNTIAFIQPEHCLDSSGNILCFSNSFSNYYGSLGQTFLKLKPDYLNSSVGYGYHFEWLASDWISPSKLIVSGRSWSYSKSSNNFETLIFDTTTNQWTFVDALKNMEIHSIRTLNLFEIIFIGKYDSEPAEQTRLMKLDLLTHKITTLKTGEGYQKANIFMQ